ncbi:MAG: hypothetical protein JW856_02000 [Dehalococcoidales bacterium]|nr:hypothetical protein [Dehalococcoidales bacterium]
MRKEEIIDANKLKLLVTVQGLINAGLFIWVQYWVRTYEIYVRNKPPDPVWHISLFISILYISMFVSLIGMLFALLSFKKALTAWLPRISLSLFGLSFSSIIAIVLASIIGIVPKAFSGAEKWHASELVDKFDSHWITVISYGSMLVVFLIIFLFSKKWTRRFLESDN